MKLVLMNERNYIRWFWQKGMKLKSTVCVNLIASENGWKWISWIKNDNIDQIKKHGVVDVRPTYTSKITYLPTK
jgi:hypothetical protein